LQAKEYKRALGQRRKALKTKAQHLKDAQAAFNAFIRLRDMDKPCVSCGRFHNGKWNAGHYRPVGGLGSPLRFNELNAHRQCEPCNSHLSGNLVPYRVELIKRVGLPLVEWLEKDHPSQKWTIPEVQCLTKYYKDAKKHMMNEAGAAEPF
jgi:hypothetical protein